MINKSINLLKTAKELNIGLSRAGEILKRHGHIVELRPNTKLTDEMYEILKKEFMATKITKVIAKKIRSTPTNPNLGYIKPILKLDNISNDYKKVHQSSEFPNDGEIFVIAGYNYIDGVVDTEELFEISEINENDTNYDPDRSGSCLYTAKSSSMRKLARYEFLRIYKLPFDLDKKTVNGLPAMSDDSPFFLDNGQSIYGPFNIDVVTLTVADLQYFEEKNFENPIEELVSDYEDYIFKYDKTTVGNIIVEDYIINLIELLKLNPAERLYFGSKEKIIEWGKRMLGSALTEEEKAMLRRVKDIPIPETKSSSDLQKLNKFRDYINETDTWLNVEVPQYFNGYLASEQGIILLNKYLEDNQEFFFEQYRATEIQRINAEIASKGDLLTSIEQEIAAAEKMSGLHEDKIFESLSESEKSKIKTIILNTDERVTLLDYFDSNKDLNEIKNDITKLKGQKEYLESENSKHLEQLRDLTEAIKQVKDDFMKGSDFAKKVIDAKIYSDLINNIDPSYTEDKSSIVVEPKQLPLNESIFTTKQFIEEVQTRLIKQNRVLTFNEIANYLVLINQNFIVIMAGLPGTGKTSMVEKLAKILGSDDNGRYFKIPVARGWTSSKDILGYFNPLTKRYQPAKTGLYDGLKIAELDSKNGVEVPTIILLDEANLSPMEHYWSEFLTLADFDAKREISTSEKEKITISAGIRFLATVNYDHTTELLSDRLLSRAPVIRLNISDYKTEDNLELESEIYKIFSMDQLNQYLNKGVKDNFKGDIKNKFDNVVRILQDEDNNLGQPIIIGMRKYKAVEKYCNVAGSIMDGPNSKFIALDYAIYQYILPLLNGRGENFLKRLLELKEQLQALPMSLKHLNRIIQFGNDNFKNYKFFC